MVAELQNQVRNIFALPSYVEPKPKHQLRPVVYIAGPMLSEGNAYTNIRNAILAGEYVYSRGWAPIIPHLNCLVSMVTGESDPGKYLQIDLSILSKCDAMFLLPYTVASKDGVLSGTHQEVDFAEENNIPVYNESSLPFVGVTLQ